MADTFLTAVRGLDSPVEEGFNVTPNDSTDFEQFTRGIYVGVTGNLAIHTVRGSILTFVGLASGIIHPIRVRRVLATGTTATSIIGVY